MSCAWYDRVGSASLAVYQVKGGSACAVSTPKASLPSLEDWGSRTSMGLATLLTPQKHKRRDAENQPSQ